MKNIVPVSRVRGAARPARSTALVFALLMGLIWLVGSASRAHAQSSANGGDGDSKKSTQKDAKPPKKSRGPAVPKRDILVFPTDTKGGPSDAVGGIITDVIKGRLEASELYQPSTFSVASPTFRRALTEQTLVAKDVKPPYDTNAKVQKLTQFAGYNIAVTASIDDYEYDAAKQQVSIVVTVTLIDFSSGKPQPRPFGDSAATDVKAVKDQSDTGPVITVARNLTEKIMTELLKPAKPASK
jgi:hypothetical protein